MSYMCVMRNTPPGACMLSLHSLGIRNYFQGLDYIMFHVEPVNFFHKLYKSGAIIMPFILRTCGSMQHKIFV